MDEPQKNIVETVLDRMAGISTPHTMLTTASEAQDTPELGIIALHQDMRPHDLTPQIDAIATKLQPWRRTGTARMLDLASLIAWANRNKGETSVLFANTGKEPSLTCIADYLGAGAPVIDHFTRDPAASHCKHRATYTFPLSEEWKTWSAISGKAMTKAEFGEFIENNAKDLLDPTPALLGSGRGETEAWEDRMIDVAAQLQGRFGQYATLVKMAREFQVNEVSNITTTLNRDTGESSVQFLNEHQQPDGQALTIPNLFMIAIPAFDRGAAYRLAVRFRYRKVGQDVRFIMSLYNPDVALDDALEEALEQPGRKPTCPCSAASPRSDVPVSGPARAGVPNAIPSHSPRSLP